MTIRQDREAQIHTGGIVWETAFLLALFLEHGGERGEWRAAGQRVLEVGAGCGLLGMVLAAAGCDVVLTEHPVALANLRHNVGACAAAEGRARVHRLDWEDEGDARAVQEAQRARGSPPTFDTIVGTDVVFAEGMVQFRRQKPLAHIVYKMFNPQFTPL